MLMEQIERIEDNIKAQKRIADITIKRELGRQKKQWNEFVRPCILSIFLVPDLKSSFFVSRDSLRKRSNLSFDKRLFMKAPNNIEFRMPVAVRKLDGGIEAFDPYGSMKIIIEKEPEYELTEDKIYIMQMKKYFPMYPLNPVLGEKKNGVELYLKPTPLPLFTEPDEDTDFTDFAYLSAQPGYIRTENEAIDIITNLQNYYRLKDYFVERKDATTIVVDAKETFIITYSPNLYCLKLGLFI